MPNLTLGTNDSLPKFKVNENPEGALDLLRPGSDHHKYVLDYCLERIKASEDEMTKFYARWQVAERKMQAYLSLPNYEQMLKEMNDSSKPPAPAIILFPYKYAVISSIVTYAMKVICGKKPFLPLGADSKEAADNIRYMEAMMQRQLTACKAIMRFFQLLLDGELYGLGVMRNMWEVRQGNRRAIRPPSDAERMMYANDPSALPSLLRDKQATIVFQGNSISNIDPFMFFPDPNVPMAEVAEKGEYVFWRDFQGKHLLISAQKQGLLKYVDSVEAFSGNNSDTNWYNLSNRSALSGGKSSAGDRTRNRTGQLRPNTYMIDQGTVEIIPQELGLGPEDYPVKWLFTILNKKQIVQAEPLDLDHNRHPVAVSEPYSLGYGFGQPALGDYIGPIQDIISWFLDAHIYNVRSSLNNQWLYDPSKINEQDLKYPQPGKHIRLQPLAYGTDVRQALTQFPVTDVTRNHVNDVSAFIRVGDMVSAVNDSMRGVPTPGRRTASDARMTNESGGNRLQIHTQLISQMALMPLAEQMVQNIQQLQDGEAWVKVIGASEFQAVGPQLLMGNFTFAVHDGTLPLDTVATFDLWKEVLLGVAQSPVLQQTHSLPRIFEHVCQIGGAPNITSYRLVSDQEMDKLSQAGNALTLPQASAAAPPQVM